MLVASAMAFSSSFNDMDQFYPITAYNQLTGVYTISGKVYNYSGPVTWVGPPAAVPSSYVSTVN